MPPRYAYWTILIDGKPTAFRAKEKEELLPTFQQLRRTNSDVVFKWFARGRVWDSPEEARAAAERPRPPEKRGRDWRPGGEHKDPRARFKKSRDERRAEFRPSAIPRGDRPEPRRDQKPAAGPAGPRDSRPWTNQPRAKRREDFRPPQHKFPKPHGAPPPPRDRRATTMPRPSRRDETPRPPDPGFVKRERPKRS